ncbi:MAG: aminoglycoside phosphotransferase family protein [Chloroflexota bacterium]
MQLPDSFISNIHTAFQEDGRRFLAALPSMIDDASKSWGLRDIHPVPNLSYNFVAFAKRSPSPRFAGRGQGEGDVVLKIGVPHEEFYSEIAALIHYNGDGAVKLLEFDPEHSMFLLERLKPGEMLATLEDDDQRTRIAADVMLKLRGPLESDSKLSDVHQQAAGLHKFIKLTDWFDGLKNLHPMFGGGTGPFPEKIVARVEETLPRLYTESKKPCLIHGDFHHFNVLSSERGWIVIDPKGVIGHPEYEVGPLMINPWGKFLNGIDPRTQTERRLDILSERLGLPRQRLLDWALCHAVLSAWWDTKPDGTGGEYSIRCAELFTSI